MKSLLTLCSAALMLAACGQQTGEGQQPESAVEQTPVEEMFVEVYDSGQPKIKGLLVDGKRHGLWVSFYENGVRWSEENYQLGVLEGRSISFYPSGHFRYRGQYLDGEKSGLWQFYDEEGKLVKELEF